MPVSRRKNPTPRWTPRIVPRNGALELDAPLFMRRAAKPSRTAEVLRYARDRLQDLLRRR